MEYSRRELKAIMFTDIKSFSRMMGEDENRTILLVKEHRDLFRSFLPQFRGVERATAGDSFFVLFSSALEAVNCAIQIQTAFSERNRQVSPDEQLTIRIGIHLGDVFFDDSDRDVFGESINIAARTEPLALPGSICITDTVLAQVRSKLKLPVVPGRKMVMKNISNSPGIFHIALDAVQLEELNANYSTPEEPAHNLPGSEAQPAPVAGNKALPVTKKAMLIFCSILVVLSAALLFFRHRPLPAPPNSEVKTAKEKKILLLAFNNITGKKDDEWLSVGIADSIEIKLAAVKEYTVLSRHVVCNGPDKAENLKNAKNAGAELLLTGSYQKFGDQIKIVSSITDLQQGNKVIHSTECQGRMDEIFNLQDEISLKIISLIGTEASSELKKNIQEKWTRNLDAFRSYSLGIKSRESGDLIQAIKHFHAAVQHDPKFLHASRMIKFISSETEYIRFLADGSIHHSMQITSHNRSYWSTNIGKVITAEDIHGQPLPVRCENNMSFIDFPVDSSSSKPYRFFLEIQNCVTLSLTDQAYNYVMQVNHMDKQQISNIFELPEGYLPVSVAPLPVDRIVEGSKYIFLVKDTRYSSDSFLQSHFFTNDRSLYEKLKIFDYNRLADYFSRNYPSTQYNASLSANCVLAFRYDSMLKDGTTPELPEVILALCPEQNPQARFLAEWVKGRILVQEKKQIEAAKAYMAALSYEKNLYFIAADIYQWLLEQSLSSQIPVTPDQVVMTGLSHFKCFNDGFFGLDIPGAEYKKDTIPGEYTAALQDFKKGDFQSCFTRLEKLEQNSQNLYISLLMARSAMQMGTPGNAGKYYERIISFFPSNWMWLEHVDMCLAFNRPADALITLQTMRSAENSNYPLSTLLTRIISSMEDPASNFPDIEKAVDNIYARRDRENWDFSKDEIYYFLAISFDALKNRDDEKYRMWVFKNYKAEFMLDHLQMYSNENLFAICRIFSPSPWLTNNDRSWLLVLIRELYERSGYENEEYETLMVRLLMEHPAAGALDNPDASILSYEADSIQAKNIRQRYLTLAGKK